MNQLQNLLLQQRHNYQKWDVLVFTALTLLALLNGKTTVFYLIYFFWWNELLRIVIDKFFHKRNNNAQFIGNPADSVFSSLFIMGIYFVFIVVFFGFIATSENTDLLMVNMQTLLFQNWFFTINLLFFAFERIYLHTSNYPLNITFGGFTPNMIVLHISIIIGGVIMFFIVKQYPNVFTPTNFWGSVVIALPFLLLKIGLDYLSTTK